MYVPPSSRSAPVSRALPRLLACLGLICLLTAAPSLAEEGRIPIFEPVTLDGTSQNISGNYVVTRDITTTTGIAAITVLGGTDQSVEIDLNGFTLTGDAASPSVVSVSGLASFRLRNGTVVSHNDSADTVLITGTSADDDRAVIEDVKVKGGDEGIFLDNMTSFILRRNVVVEVLGSGIRIADNDAGTDELTGLIEENVLRETEIGIEIRDVNRAVTVRNNHVVNPFSAALIGIRARYSRSLILEGNNIAGGGVGIQLGDSGLGAGSGCDECLIHDNAVSNSAVSGMQFYDVDECSIWNNVANSNTEYGLDLNESDRNFIDHNHFNRNDKFGIYLRSNSVGNSYGRNVLRDNDPDPPAETCSGSPGSPCGAPAVCDESGLDPASAAPADAEANRSFGDNSIDAPGGC